MTAKNILTRIVPALGFVALVTGIWTGLQRMGYSLPMISLSAASLHGLIMTGSFLGTLISFERAIMSRLKISLIVPILSGLSGIFLLTGQKEIGQILLLSASIGYLIIIFPINLKFTDSGIFFCLGGLCWIFGNILIMKTGLLPQALPWWIGFLFFTVFAERITLSQFLKKSKVASLLKWSILILFLSSLMFPFHSNGNIIFGIALILASGWLLKYDMAIYSIKKAGWHRFSGITLMIGYTWLGVSGILFLSDKMDLYNYDAKVHTFYLGFIFSMIFAHAAHIFPPIFKLPSPKFSSLFYFILAFFEGALVIRIISDLFHLPDIRIYSGIMTGIGIIAFFATLMIMIYLNKKK
ncbi:hypothetical protein OO013_06800 [Mangrovivirga sp. M17]|uniref:Uncharacterized protein n=1 Tax=Mangrovivirga halotolerans TaxID=2993936 RepID=A0ABT3RPL3_9BACT|nr:hypothetical protein [Mangrovivirga halotolerans]MCX2743566.1 hypothetical protein [Mangrovivirga halotolerans]